MSEKGLKIREKIFLTNTVRGKGLFNLLDAPLEVQAHLSSFLNFETAAIQHLTQSLTHSKHLYMFISAVITYMGNARRIPAF